MASQVMTISRTCVLLWFTIFFETVIPTTPSAFTAADTSPYATDSTTDNMTDFATTTISNNTTENVSMVTVFQATTIPNNTTENVTMVTVFPATTIPNNTTGNVTMVTVFPATTISNYTTENVTMVTVFPATTIPNNTTENVTMATVFPATTISNNTTENVTMVTVFPATTISNNTTENVSMVTVFPATTISKTVTASSTSTDADTSPYTTGDAPTAIPLECDCKAYVIIAVFSLGGNTILLVILVVKSLGSRKSPALTSKGPVQPRKYTIFKDDEEQVLYSNDSVQPGNYGTIKDDEVQFSRRHGEDVPYEDRISYYELWKFVQYATELKEDDILKDAIKNLRNENVIESSSTNPSTDKDLYGVLRIWKKQWDKPGIDPIEVLFEKCEAAGMVKSIRKIRDLRRIVSDVQGSTSNDLEHMLRHIGRKSKDNITSLLEKLKLENLTIGPVHSTGLDEIVKEALTKLIAWQEELAPINPVVMISLTLEDLEFSEDVVEGFFSM